MTEDFVSRAKKWNKFQLGCTNRRIIVSFVVFRHHFAIFCGLWNASGVFE